jgi:Restriction Enzyme Adenine Methylase Associated
MSRKRHEHPISFSDLMQAGIVTPGTRVHANHHGRRYEATVTRQGLLKLPGVREALSLSGAAKQITRRETNGWAFWLVAQADGSARSLRRLREELLYSRGGALRE